MTRREFLAHRAAFCGLPFGELVLAMARVESGARWEDSFLEAARRLRRLAIARQAAGRARSAADGWLWAASAYQVASFGLHFAPDASRWLHRGGRLARLRQLAELCYLRALSLDGALGRPVAIPAGEGGCLRGYWRRPLGDAAGAVVLVNGLDSICEVELHRFGDAFLQRGLAVLALRLPEAAVGAGLGYRAERASAAIAAWIERRHGLERHGIGCFGVSFGGHLVMRLLAAEPRFTAGVAVSPPAWLDAGPECPARIRRMLELTFGLRPAAALERYAAGARLDRLPAPQGRLLVFLMERDELFGAQHLAAIAEWTGGERLEVQSCPAEHVGTSHIHQWLPDACDWLQGVLAASKGLLPCTAQ